MIFLWIMMAIVIVAEVIFPLVAILVFVGPEFVRVMRAVDPIPRAWIVKP